MHIPDGFCVVTPYIFVDDADRYARFLGDAFAAHEIGRTTGPNGRIANCQVQIATTRIMIADSSDQFPASRSAFYLFVADADAAMAIAKAAGAEQIMDVADMPYGDRQGGVQDRSGNIWWISQRLTDKPYFQTVL